MCRQSLNRVRDHLIPKLRFSAYTQAENVGPFLSIEFHKNMVNLLSSFVKFEGPKFIKQGRSSVWKHYARFFFSFLLKKTYTLLWGCFYEIQCIHCQKTLQAIYTLYRLDCQIKAGLRKNWVKEINPTSYLKCLNEHWSIQITLLRETWEK